MEIYERLDELDAATAETKAARILHGLGVCVCTDSFPTLCHLIVCVDHTLHPLVDKTYSVVLPSLSLISK